MSTNLFDLTGKAAIVTGASGGLGVHFAKFLAQAGADLAICARRLQRLEETGRMVRSLGRRCLVIQTDVTQPGQVGNLVTRTLQEYGKIDILVNNAGIVADGVAEEATLEEFNQVIQGNLISVFICSQRVGREMLARGYGRIINIASVSGVNAGVPVGNVHYDACYTPSKSGVIGLTKEFAVQWAKRGVTVNVIAPAYFPSDLVENFYDLPGVRDSVESHTPMGRIGRTEELAGPLVFLASDASSYVTGQTICVDGGWTAW